MEFIEKALPVIISFSRKLLALILAPIYIASFLIMHFTFDWWQGLWK